MSLNESSLNLLLSTVSGKGEIAGWFREHLGPHGTIVGTSNARLTPGFAACDLSVLMPDIYSDEYIPAMLELCMEEDISMMLSFLDLDVFKLAAHRHLFEAAGVRALVPDADVSATCYDKVAAYEWLQERGFQTARTWADAGAAFDALSKGDLRFPCIVKPRHGTGSYGVVEVFDEGELAVALDRYPATVFPGPNVSMIAQQKLPGDEYGVDVLNDLSGNVVSVVVKRKLRMRGGETWRAVTVRHAGAIDVSERLARALGHVGALDLDLFIDGDDVYVLDINHRLGGAYAFSHYAGADFPRKICAMVRGDVVSPDIGDYEVGIEAMKESRTVPASKIDLVDLVDRRTPA